MIRKLLLRFIITGVAVAGVAYFVPGIFYSGGFSTLLKIIGVFFLANIFLKPILKILSLPIEIATLGLFGIVINAFILWFVSVWIEEFRITSFWFSGFAGSGFVIAPIELPVWMTAVVGSLLISFVSTFLYWLTKGK